MDNLVINSSIKDVINRSYRRRKIIFKHDIHLCLVFRLDNYIYLLEIGDMPSLTLRLFDRLDGSACSNKYIAHNKLYLMQIIVADNKMIATSEIKYGNVDIHALILNKNIHNISDKIYYDYIGLETEGNVLDMLPKVK